jgi:hypothetical protein
MARWRKKGFQGSLYARESARAHDTRVEAALSPEGWRFIGRESLYGTGQGRIETEASVPIT